jgi:hypothetical protein
MPRFPVGQDRTICHSGGNARRVAVIGQFLNNRETAMPTSFGRIMVALVAILSIFALAAPASAQATRTWVSGVGDDANPCSRTAPCKTFAGAISKTAAGGEINALDPGGYGAVTITKSITIRAQGVLAGVLVSGTNAITINAATTDRVVLEGLDIEGLGTGLAGVNILQATEVIVRDSAIRNFRSGIGAGIHLNNSGATTRLVVENVQFIGNLYGIRSSSAVSSKTAVNNSLFVSNTTAGISVTGASNGLQLNGNAIYSSNKGVELQSGAVGRSFGNNAIGTAASDPLTVTPLG